MALPGHAKSLPLQGERYRRPETFSALSLEAAFFPPLAGSDTSRAPAKLYAAGDTSILRAGARVSIVGAREASADGRRRSARLAKLLAQAGVVIVSGLAKGIDYAAHTASIEAGGRTIAVIGTPLDRCYPAAHAHLQEEIYRDHLLVSQFENGAHVHPSFFSARNRTMAMLSHASVIVEASDTSGSLSQAAETQRLKRPLFIMRNVAESAGLTWPASFLRNGAIILDDIGQVLDALKA